MGRVTIFFHPDYTVGPGITPGHAFRLVGYTTGGEFHPALKIILFNCPDGTIMISICQAFFPGKMRKKVKIHPVTVAQNFF
jgi:hypothetical protein